MVKIVTIFLFIYAFTFESISQDLNLIQRMSSTQSDVVKFLGNGQKINEFKSLYDLSDKRLVIYYYGDSCTEGYFVKYKQTKNTVQAMTVLPKSEFQLSNIPLIEQFKKFELLNNKRAYWDNGLNTIVVSKTFNKKELVEAIYYLPLSIGVPECSVKDLSEDSGIDLLAELEKRLYQKTEFPTQYLAYFSKDSTKTKEETIKEFCETLNRFPKGEGYIYISLKKNESHRRYTFYENQLKTQLRKNKCKISQIKFVKTGFSTVPDQAFFNFLIIPENILK